MFEVSLSLKSGPEFSSNTHLQHNAAFAVQNTPFLHAYLKNILCIQRTWNITEKIRIMCIPLDIQFKTSFGTSTIWSLLSLTSSSWLNVTKYHPGTGNPAMCFNFTSNTITLSYLEIVRKYTASKPCIMRLVSREHHYGKPSHYHGQHCILNEVMTSGFYKISSELKCQSFFFVIMTYLKWYVGSSNVNTQGVYIVSQLSWA